MLHKSVLVMNRHNLTEPDIFVSFSVFFASSESIYTELLDRSCYRSLLTLLHSERPKLYAILAFLSAIGLNHNPTALRKAKIVCNFGFSECNRVKSSFMFSSYV